MANLRSTVREFNVYRWAGKMLTDAARLRLRDRISERVQRHRAEDEDSRGRLRA
jgi:trehalose 6-phosphate synthase